MEAVATSCGTHGECPWSMGPYSRELRNDAYPLGAPGEVPPGCPRGHEPANCEGGNGWLRSVRRKRPPWCACVPFVGETTTGTGPGFCTSPFAPQCLELGQAISPHPPAGNVHCGVLSLRRADGGGVARTTPQPSVQLNANTRITRLLKCKGGTIIGWSRGSPQPLSLNN